ncbi:MAG: hypothetical protein JW839_18895, partial [Candidatus Lokiarchaeota archaeon]|nr:hypothetical protein [Candidatus Lokiarchaeota archaeon]
MIGDSQTTNQITKVHARCLLLGILICFSAMAFARLLGGPGGGAVPTDRPTLEQHDPPRASAFGIVGTYNTPGGVYGVFVSGDVAYVAD